MKLFHFHQSDENLFASAIRRGTWFPKDAQLCPACHTSTQKRITPLIIEWEPGSNKVGDFVWPALDTELVVTQRVKEVLEEQFQELEFSIVELWQNPKIKQPSVNMKRTKPRIWLPYTGPTLWAVTPKKWCHLDHKKSNVKVSFICPYCNKMIFDVPNLYDNYLVLDTNTWSGEDVFHIHEYSGAIFCTNKVKEIAEHLGFMNVQFIEDGEISPVAP